MKRSWVLPCLLLCITVPVAATNRTNFLSHGPSTEAYGRGETGASSGTDIAAAFYNPSLLSGLPNWGASLSEFPLYDGSNYSFAGIGKNIDNFGFIGLSAINLTSGEVELRENLTLDADNTTQAKSWAYLISYARPLPRLYGITAGANIKYISLDIDQHSGGALGADIGLSRGLTLPALFESETELQLGLAAINILQPSVTLISQADTYATTYRAGASWHVPTVMRALDFDTASIYTDVVMEDSTINCNAGLEYAFAGRYIARAGMYGDHYTAGLGYRLSILHVDYAMDFAGYTSFNRFSVSYFWGDGQKHQPSPRQPAADNTVITSSAAHDAAGVTDLMVEAKQALALSKEQQAARDKEITVLYKAAKKDYNKKRYLVATEKFSNLIMNYPECKNAAKYYLLITEKMFGTATSDSMSDFEELSYAKGYVAYKQQNFHDALNEWEKVIQTNPKRTELTEYIEKASVYLKDQARAAREREANEKAQAIFDEGVKHFNDNKLVACIKKMESLQDFCKAQPDFSKAADWTNKATEYINKSLKDLAASLKKERKARTQEVKVQEQKKPEVELDTEGADKRYKEGLILYAQGKTSDAINMWEIAIRLNPNHEKAQKAIVKANEELKR